MSAAVQRKRRAFLAAALAGMLAGGALAAHGAYIPAKARVAQVLLQRAWERTRHGEAQAKPWPWADTFPVARLRVPELGVDLLVLRGADGRAMAFAPGSAFGTALPGEPGNAVIAAHRDTHFAFLRDVKAGTRMLVERADGTTLEYDVAETRVVDHLDASAMSQDGATRLTLVTCWPLDAPRAGGPLRYVVTALAVTPEPAEPALACRDCGGV